MDGVIIINKPKGITSNDVVQRIKKLYNKKVGHAGTLDPMATGVLPILIGKGTLCSKYLINHDKIYRVVLELGKKTDTADIEGKIIENREVDEKILKSDVVEVTLKSFLGKQTQIPPMYSAIKVNGKKLYEYARKGKKVEVKPREIEIYSIKLLSIKQQRIEFVVSCSKGTYIRSLCEDIAEKLGTVGFMAELERQKVGEFDIENSITIEKLENLKNEMDKFYISIEKLFCNLESIEIKEGQYKLFLNGGRIIEPNKLDGVYKIYFNNKFIGTGIIEKERLKRDIIII